MVPGSHAPSVAAWLKEIFRDLSHVSANPADAGLLNRLDYETSGCLLAAKNREIWQLLRAALKAGDVHKEYLAILEGEFPAHLVVEGYIGSPYRRAKKVRFRSSCPPHTRRFLPSRSEFTQEAYDSDKDASLVKVSADTARRHQIRVHATVTGHPLIGDALYGSKRSLRAWACGDKLPPFFLHAFHLSFKHPINCTAVSITAKPHFLPVSLPIFYAIEKICNKH